MQDFIQLFGILLIVITAISFVVKLLKQPIIIGYVLAGVIFASIFIAEGVTEQVHIFSELGITFLLFLLGLEFDLRSLKYLGKDIFIATFWQSVFFFIFPALLSKGLGFTTIESVYVGILFMFSSTLLVAKWVDDKKESGSLHGKITLSILIIQDVIAILILTVMSVLRESNVAKILFVPFQGLILVLVGFILSKYLLNRPLKFSSKYPELLFIMGLSVCFLFVQIAPLLGYSTTIGAFIGGIVLANTLYKTEVVSRLKPLVTFFNMLFFVGLGFQMQFNFTLKYLILLGLLLLFNFILKPVIIYITLRSRGYDLKTAFFTGTYLSQFSEFGIIIIAAGVASKQIDTGISSVALISVILTMVFSSYLIKYDKKIFKFFDPKIKWFDKRFVTKDIKFETVALNCNILFFGYFELNKELMEKFKKEGKKIIVVENDPENIVLLEKEGIEVIYNSINNPDFFEIHNFSGVEIVISGILDAQESKQIIMEVKKENPKALLIVTAKTLKDSIELYNNDADYVIYSAMLNEQKISLILEEYTSNMSKVLEKKIGEIQKLKERDARIKANKSKDAFLDIDSFLHQFQDAFGRKKVSGALKEPDKKKEEPKFDIKINGKKSFEFTNVVEKYLK